MRTRLTLPTLLFALLGALPVFAGEEAAVEAVSDDQAKEALKDFEEAFRSGEIEEKQAAIYNLHDVPHDRVIKRLARLLRDRDPQVRNVAALALGGQRHNPEEAGEVLLKAYDKESRSDDDLVISSILDGLRELAYLEYWPDLEEGLEDERSAVVIRTLDLLGANQDWRAFPKLLELYKVAMPKRVNWTTGTVTVDTGTAGDGDQKAAEAKWNAKYGRGGSKEKRKAQAKAKAFDERNFDAQLRRCVKAITGETFDNALDMQDWYVENYLEVHRRIAEMSGQDVDRALKRAKAELPELKEKVEEEHRKLEEQLAKAREEAEENR